MFHIIYKTIHQNGKYYVGRHSTKILDDGYLGSGKWVLSIDDKSLLTREVISYHDSYDELLEAEQKIIDENFGKDNCMNFNNRSSGFAAGDVNWACTEEGRRWRSENSHMKTPQMKQYFSENNPSKLDSVKEKRRVQAERELSEGTHNFLRPDVRKKAIEKSKERCLTDNPAKRPDVKIKLRQNAIKQKESGNWKLNDPEVRLKSVNALKERISKKCTDGKQIFSSIKEMADYYGLHDSTMLMRIRSSNPKFENFQIIKQINKIELES